MENQIKKYEIGYLTVAEEDAAELIKILKSHKAEIFDEGKPKKIRLAYPIKKEIAAFFNYARFSMEAHSVKLLSEKLKLTPKIIRFMVINLPKEALMEREERPQRPGAKPRSKPMEEIKKPTGTDFVTNELLEKKLEEILK